MFINKYKQERELKKKIERAAKLKGMEVSEFISWALLEASNRTLELEGVAPKIFP